MHSTPQLQLIGGNARSNIYAARIARERGTTLVAFLLACAVGACGGGGGGGHSASSGTTEFSETELVADASGQAAFTDQHLVNPWGIAASPTGPFWIADNGQGVSTLYDGTGQPIPAGGPLVVTVPPPEGSPGDMTAAPTGIVFNGTTDFVVTDGAQAGPSLFIFATEDGTIAGWNSTVDATAAILAVDRSSTGAEYKGLALASGAGQTLLYATDFHNGHVDVFDPQFAPAVTSGTFTDPGLPGGFAPFGIAAIADTLYVTYAKQDADQHDDVRGPGNGFVDVFDLHGGLVRRVASRGTLNSPWGVVHAPAVYGGFADAVFVGNFGDGRINAFDATSGAFLGQLSDGNGPITIDGLWGLSFGNGGTAGDPNTLFFTAGPDDEQHGRFGALRPVASGM